jgi:hypothetical protein
VKSYDKKVRLMSRCNARHNMYRKTAIDMVR